MSLGPVGRLMEDPPVPFHQLQEMWYPWYQTSSAAPECLASELGLPVIGKVVECSVQLGLVRLSATWL
jgi:hypothetical protein